ncbi:MAG: hypothetical protein ACRDHN_09630 [Thermomicrobiales bacterium]
MKNWVSKNVRYLILVLMLGAGVLGATLTDAATPTASPTAIASPQAEQVAPNVCPTSAIAEQWPEEIREDGTTRLAYQRTEQGSLVYISSTVCRDPGVDVGVALYPASTIIVVDSGELIVTLTSGIARINIGNTVIAATLGDTFTLLPGDSLILDSGVQAEFPATSERTVLNILTITVSSVPTGCTHACWLP